MKKADKFAESTEIANAIAVAPVPAEGKEYGISPGKHVIDHSPAHSSLEDVPQEVRDQLSGYDDMIAEERLLKVLESGGQFTLDKIILALWHRFKHSEPRNKVITRLRSLTKLHLVNKVPGARSIYQLRPGPVMSLEDNLKRV